MPSAPVVEFTRFVSSVEGRVVSRWDAPGSVFGAKVATLEERKAGAEPIVWDPERVVPLTAAFCARFERELRNAVRNGDLRERTRADWEAWLKVEEQREAEHVAKLAAPTAAEVTPPIEAEPKPGRKGKA